ncbi:MAG: DUF4831 family protein [Bacteroidetes bacterium]|nr:DUF4831 family protein [Bacteroidota bacterium]
MKYFRFSVKILYIFLFIPLVSIGQIKVSPLHDSLLIVHKEGITYSLPRTRLTIDVTLSKITREKGLFSEYARQFLGIDNAISKNSVTYEIIAIHVSPEQEPDPGQVFLIEQKKTFPYLRKSPLVITYTPQGFLSSINWPSMEAGQNPYVENSRNFGMDSRFEKNEKKPQPVYYLNKAAFQKEEKQPVRIDSAIQAPLRKPVFKMDPVEVQRIDQAREVLETLNTIRENRQKLASGYQEITYENGTIRLMMDQLNELEDNLVKLFTGTSREEIKNFTLSFLPEPGDSTAKLLAYINETAGIQQEASEGSRMITIKVTPTLRFPTFSVKPDKSVKKYEGLVYRIPNMAECRIFVGNQTVFTGQFIINQLGQTAALPSSTNHIILYPETGGIKSVK